MTDLVQEKLSQLFDYEPSTGIFRRKVSAGRGKVGSIAGTIDNYGYRVIKIEGVSYKAHRLAFLWMTGKFPSGQVDHINRDKDDNSWLNLREATPSENRANVTGWPTKSEDLPKGVFRRGNRFRSVICKNGRNIYLGTFNTIEDADRVYKDAALAIFGQFARM